MRRHRYRIGAGAAVVAIAATASWYCFGVAWAEPAAPDWHDCGGRAKCATLPVPIDWHDPDGPATKVNLAKLPARDPGTATGTIVVNLGAGNVTGALEAAQLPPGVQALNEHHDLVGFDPRGLGKADNGTLIECAKPQAPYPGLILAETRADWRAHAEANAKYERGCREAAGEQYRGLTSWQVAHDLEALRAALGEDKLDYFGNSYGTGYGQAYAELFGAKVNRMYLEGVADHTQERLSDWLGNYARSLEQQFDAFADWCADRSGCALNGEDVGAVWDELLERAEAEPLPAPGAGDGETVSAAELLAGTHYGMNPPSWPRLAAAVDAARNGDAADFLTELAWPPGESGYVQAALLCNDFMPEVPGRDAALRIERNLREVAPRIGWTAVRAELSRCVGVTAEPAYPPHRLDIDELPPVLVGIGDLDQTTPRLGAEAVAKQLPGSRVLRNGDGHAAFILGNKCLAEHVTAYFDSGELPAEGTRCPGELVEQLPDRP